MRLTLKKLTKIAAVTGLALLAGCAGLEVRVDVYKGPLANHEDIQMQQLTSIAMSARVLMVTQRDQTLKELGALKACTTRQYLEHRFLTESCLPGAGSNKSAVQQSKFRRAVELNGILGLFEEDSSYIGTFDPLYLEGRAREGIDRLAKAYQRAIDNQAGRDRSSTTERDREARYARKRLVNALVDLAGRMSYLAVNLYLVDGDTGAIEAPEGAAPSEAILTPTPAGSVRGQVDYTAAKDEFTRFKSILEAVANTLLVYADDMHLRDRHQDRQGTLADEERRAAVRAFAMPEQAFERVFSELRTKSNEASRKVSLVNSKLKEVRAELTKAKSELAAAERVADETQKSSSAALKNLAQVAALFALLDQSRTACEAAAKAAGDADLASAGDNNCVELTAVLTATNKSAATVTLEGLRLTVEEALKAARAKYSGELAKGPLPTRLDAALVAISALAGDTTGPVASKVALTKLRANSQDLVKRAQRTADDARAKLADAMKSKSLVSTKVDSLTTRVNTLESEATVLPSAATWESMLAAAQALRSRVTGASSQGGDAEALRVSLADEATKVAARPETSAADKLTHDSLASEIKKLELTSVGLTAPSASNAGTSTQVLDSVIAQLRYEQLAVLKKEGSGSDHAKWLGEAIDAAFKQRAGMAYLRPASAYLRSVFTATANQSSPNLSWQNMLLDGYDHMKAGIKSIGGDPPETAGDILDKAFWQNINVVRLSASGSSNFVVAKDDVGNWYVKAMGADPGAMIRTAKNLALFNLGQRIPTNLLHADELRARRDDTTLTNTERDAARDELSGLMQGPGSPSGDGRSVSQGLFKTSFAKNSARQLEDLAQQVELKRYASEIRTRWAATYGAAFTAKFEPDLEAVLTRDEAANQMAKASAAVVPTSAVKDAGPAMVEALAALNRFRVAVRTGVLGLAALIADESDQLKTLDTDAATALTRRDGLLAQNSTDAEAVVAAEKALASATKDKEPEAAIKSLEVALQGKRATAAKTAIDLGEAVKKLSKATKDQSDGKAKLAAAEALRKKAADDVDVAVGKDLSQRIAERLRLISEYETALKVIGQSGKQ
jgi:hypothetical protein